MLTLTQRQVLPAVNDPTTFYVVMQPVTQGATETEYVSPILTFVPSTGTFQLNGANVITSTTQYPGVGTALHGLYVDSDGNLNYDIYLATNNVRSMNLIYYSTSFIANPQSQLYYGAANGQLILALQT